MTTTTQAVYPIETDEYGVTTWLPLTTVFTVPAGCESKMYYDGSVLMAFDPSYGLEFDHDAHCVPEAMTSFWDADRLPGYNPSSYTSIGPVTCPHAWSTVSSYVHGPSTQYMCCPSSYYLTGTELSAQLASLGAPDPGRVIGHCVSDISSGAVVTYATGGNAWKIATTTLKAKSTVSAVAVIGWNVVGKAVSPSATPAAAGNHTSSLSTSTSSTSSTTPSSSSSAAPGGPISNGASSSSLPTQGSSPGLSTGAAVGIGLGVGLGVTALAALLAVLYVKRTRSATKAAGGDVFAPPKTRDDTVGAGQELDSAGAGHELDSTAAVGFPELDASAVRYQLETAPMYQELAATHRPPELA